MDLEPLEIMCDMFIQQYAYKYSNTVKESA